MEKFKFLDHPTDLKVEILGQTQEEFFANAAMAMMTYLYPKQVDIFGHEISQTINLYSTNLASLLLEWLGELLYLSDEKDVCFNDFIFEKLNDNTLTAKVFGRRVKAKNDIKKIFSDNFKLGQNDEGYIAEIVFDV